MVNCAQSLNSFRWTQCFTQATHKIKDRSPSCSWATEATGAVKQLCWKQTTQSKIRTKQKWSAAHVECSYAKLKSHKLECCSYRSFQFHCKLFILFLIAHFPVWLKLLFLSNILFNSAITSPLYLPFLFVFSTLSYFKKAFLKTWDNIKRSYSLLLLLTIAARMTTFDRCLPWLHFIQRGLWCKCRESHLVAEKCVHKDVLSSLLLTFCACWFIWNYLKLRVCCLNSQKQMFCADFAVF